MPDKFVIKDEKTNKVFDVNTANNIATLEVAGVRVKLYPQAIRLFIAVGQVFDASTAFGPRKFKRMR